MNDHLNDVSITNPARTYIPSGKSSPSTPRTYAVFAVIIALFIQVPLGLSHAVVGFCIRYASGLYVVVAPVLLGGIAFLITGGILGYSLRGHKWGQVLLFATSIYPCRIPQA